MTGDIDQYVQFPITEPLRKLGRMSEPERFEIIKQVLSRNAYIGLVLANRTLRDRRHFEQILERGLLVADASEIRYWLLCVIPRLGFRRVVSRLARAMGDNPSGVDKALYMMQFLLPEGNPRDKAALMDLWRAALDAGIVRTCITVPVPDLASQGATEERGADAKTSDEIMKPDSGPTTPDQ